MVFFSYIDITTILVRYILALSILLSWYFLVFIAYLLACFPMLAIFLVFHPFFLSSLPPRLLAYFLSLLPSSLSHLSRISRISYISRFLTYLLSSSLAIFLIFLLTFLHLIHFLHFLSFLLTYLLSSFLLPRTLSGFAYRYFLCLYYI